MEIKFLEYQLSKDNFIHNWLVVGPHVAPIESIGREGDIDQARKIQVSHGDDGQELKFSEPPVDRGAFKLGEEEMHWRYVNCRDDHFIHVSATYPTWSHARTWALTQVKLAAAVQASFTLKAYGPVDVWVNGEHSFRQDSYSQGEPASFTFQAAFEAGINQVVVRFDQVAVGECPNLLSLQVSDLVDLNLGTVRVLIPTQANRPARFTRLEKALEKAYLERYVSHKGRIINLRWAEDIQEQVNYAYQVQDGNENIFVEGKYDTNPSEPLDIGHPQRLWERPYWAVLQATGGEYYGQGLRYQRRIPLQVLDNLYSHTPYDSFASRLSEALEYAAGRESNLFGQIARLQLKKYEQFMPGVVLECIQRVNRAEVGAELLLTGLLEIFYNYKNNPVLSKSLKKSLQDCIQSSLLPLSAGEGQSGGVSLLSLTSRLLILQLYPKKKFGEVTGAQLQEETEKFLLAWMLERGRGGFREWDSSSTQELIVAALAHLISLASNPMVKDTAAVLLDKLFFGMAINSFKGANGSTQAQASAEAMKSAQMQATSGIQRILWGMGVFNPHIAGMVSLACSEYEFPLMLAKIATDLPDEMWSRESSLIDPAKNLAVNKVTYRTPDYMLSSLQDYLPGERGSTEHIWQATLDADTLVFVNHPASLGEHEALKPGFWRGNAVLPRVAQWKDVLISIHRQPEDDPLGFTHAFVPVHCFSECQIDHNWVFARLGDGYLALTAHKGIELVKSAPDAYREVRSFGRENTWIIMLGRHAHDGSFDDFQRKVIGLNVQWQENGVRLPTLRDDTLEFGWTGPFTVNGQEQGLSGFKQYDSPYCAADLPAQQMDVTDGENVMRLDFSDQ